MYPLCRCGKSPARLAKIPPRVLVVDDEPLVRWSLKAGLQAAGFEAIGAADAIEALELARQTRPPDVVLFDVRLWETDPVTLLRELRAAAPDCRFLVMAVTGQDVPFASLDRIDVIRKPFDLHEVVRLVESKVCPSHRQESAAH